MCYCLKGSWDDHLLLIEFPYNNNYLSSIAMTLFEALYGITCRSLVRWFEVGEYFILGLKIVHEAMEMVRMIKDRLATAYSRQTFYADIRKRALEFEVGDQVYSRISPMNRVMMFNKKGRLSPMYIVPYEIL